MPIGKGVVLVGMGERTTRRPCRSWPAGCSRPGRPTSAGGGPAPVAHYMHLDTVGMTMVDHGAVCAYPGVVEGGLVGGAPGDSPDDVVLERQDAGLVESMGRHLGVGRDARRHHRGRRLRGRSEQWDDGNNVLALEPGVVVAYERNTYTNTKLRKAGIEVITMPGLRARSSGEATSAHCRCPLDARGLQERAGPLVAPLGS